MRLSSCTAATAFLCALLCTPVNLLAQTVTLGGSPNVAAAEDFATRSFQDPWDMNERTDFGWFLHGTDTPGPQLTNISFSNGLFHATTGTSPNLFLLETGNPFAARLGRTGTTHPIDANTYRLIAIQLYVNAGTQGSFVWYRDNLWDGSQTISNAFELTTGWRTYLIDISALGVSSGPTGWNGLIRALRFFPSYPQPLDLYIDWIRLVDVSASLCRQVTWSGFPGAVDLYLDRDGVSNGNETMLARGVSSNSASHGCSPGGSGHNFYAGGLTSGSYQILARPAGSSGAFIRSTGAYQVNAAPMLTITSPSEEGSADDFATTQLGNAWDMDALADVDTLFNVTGPQIATVQAETPAGVSLPNTRVFSGTNAIPPAGQVGDPILALLWEGGANAGARIDPTRYRILTVDFGLPNKARNVNSGSIARIVWRVAGDTTGHNVSDDIIFNSRIGANVLDRVVVDLADRTVLPLEQGAQLSQLGWVPGSSGSPGIDRFRFDVHEFNTAVPFHVRRVKLAALERVSGGTSYTIGWTASEAGTVTLYRDTDRNFSNGGLTQIGTVAASSGAGSFVWMTDAPTGQYYIYAVIDDGQGNSNSSYARWPLVVTGPPPPSAPPNVRITQ